MSNVPYNIEKVPLFFYINVHNPNKIFFNFDVFKQHFRLPSLIFFKFFYLKILYSGYSLRDIRQDIG